MTLLSGHDAPFDYHRRLLDDPHRMDAYERALRRVVRPGDVVLDAGAGTGILALLAARLGAARVHAVESMPIARIARQLVQVNGVGDRVIVHEADLIQLLPVEPVDVVVSDFLGAFLVDDAMLGAIEAAGRWLKPGGRFVPERVELFLAPIGDFGFTAIDAVRAPHYGVSIHPLTAYALNHNYRGDFQSRLLLAPPVRVAEYQPPANQPLDREAAFTITRAGRLRGLAGWFEAHLAPGIVLSNGPDRDTHWGQVFFPLFDAALLIGDVLEAHVTWIEPEWRWSGRLRRGGEPIAEGGFETRDDFGGRGSPSLAAVLPDQAVRHERAMDENERGAQAYAAGSVEEARQAWEEATRLMPPRDPACVPIYENLGVAYLDAGRPADAARALLRALDGAPTSREQSLRLLVYAYHDAGRRADAAQALECYEQTFGRHPIRG